VALLAISGGVFWLWYALTYPATMPTMLAPPPAPRPPVKPIVAPTPTPTPPSALMTARPTPDDTEPAGAATTKAPTPARRPRAEAPQTTARAVPEVKRSAPPPATVSPELAAGYSALTHGDYPTAERQYRLALANDPASLDAYLGLATTAASSGNFAAAQAYYHKALEMDPKNAVAGAAMATLEGNSDAAESHLKAQIAALPNAAPPYSALGHIYVADSRWNDAQQVFFEAYRLDPSNPDYAFNLAVSLDHLKQGKLAREYYSRALTLSESRPAAFNPAEANARINQLGSAQP
jgi:tetratricopeptide (TPR) repeat protein